MNAEGHGPKKLDRFSAGSDTHEKIHDRTRQFHLPDCRVGAVAIYGAVLNQLASDVGEDLVGAATVVTLVIGIWSIKTKRRWFRAGVGFVVAILIVAVLISVMERVGLHYLQLLILLGFFILMAWLAARQVLFTG